MNMNGRFTDWNAGPSRCPGLTNLSCSHFAFDAGSEVIRAVRVLTVYSWLSLAVGLWLGIRLLLGRKATALRIAGVRNDRFLGSRFWGAFGCRFRLSHSIQNGHLRGIWSVENADMLLQTLSLRQRFFFKSNIHREIIAWKTKMYTNVFSPFIQTTYLYTSHGLLLQNHTAVRDALPSGKHSAGASYQTAASCWLWTASWFLPS